MSWKEAYEKKVNLPHHREVFRKELKEKVKEWRKSSCEICNKEIVAGEEYFTYWRRMRDPTMIGTDGDSVCLKCDKELETEDSE